MPHCRILYSEYLILNQGEELEVWRAAGEPRFEINTLGLGNNHASTSYFVQNCYNGNLPKERYFTALEQDQCVDETLEIAARRGDTNSFDAIKNGPHIEVMIPEAVRCNPTVEAGEGGSFLYSLH